MDADSGLWQSFSCEAQLPYVCEKLLNSTVELTGTFLTSSDKGLKISFVKSSKSIKYNRRYVSHYWGKELKYMEKENQNEVCDVGVGLELLV